MGLDLVGAAEIAEMLGVSRQRVNRIAQTHDDFPEPEAVLAGGNVWLRDKVERWAQKHRRMKN